MQLQTLLPQATGNQQDATIGDWQKLQRLLATAEDKQRPLETTEGQQTLLQTGRHKWKQPQAERDSKDQERPQKTTADN